MTHPPSHHKGATGGSSASTPHPSLAVLSGLALMAALLGLVWGCSSGMSEIDASIDRLMRERAVGPHNPAVRNDSTHPPPTRKSVSGTAPQTTNPSADALSFEHADENRDPVVRLNAYARDAAGADRQVLDLDLRAVLATAQRTGREHITAEEQYILSAIRLLIERHRWGPRLFADTSATVHGSGDEGRFQHALNVINDLRVTKLLPYGGQTEARWVWNATEQLRQRATGRYNQSSELSLSASIPLLRGAGLVARENLIQAERDLIYEARDFERFRRTYFFSITQDYFRLLQAKASISNQKSRIRSLEQQYARTKTLKEAGRRAKSDVRNVENQLLGARSSLASQRDSYIAQVDRFKIRLGLPLSQPVRIRNVAFDVPDPDVTPEVAVERALEYRLDLQNRRDALDDTRRGVLNARNRLLPDLDVSASVGIPTDPAAREGGFGIDPEELDYSAGVTMSWPLDRKIERLQLRQSMISRAQAQRQFDEFRDGLIVDVLSAVRAIELRRFQFEQAQLQVVITQERAEEQKVKEDTVTAQELIDTANDLIQAQNARDRALTDLRIAIFQYLLRTGQLRVGADGSLEPLPGMNVSPAILFEQTKDLDEWYEQTRKTTPTDAPGNGP